MILVTDFSLHEIKKKKKKKRRFPAKNVHVGTRYDPFVIAE